MNEEEKTIVRELINSNTERIILTRNLIKMVFALIVTVVLCSSITIGIQAISHDRAMIAIEESHDYKDIECTKLYFETDYGYGEINNSTDIQLNKE